MPPTGYIQIAGQKFNYEMLRLFFMVSSPPDIHWYLSNDVMLMLLWFLPNQNNKSLIMIASEMDLVRRYVNTWVQPNLQKKLDEQILVPTLEMDPKMGEWWSYYKNEKDGARKTKLKDYSDKIKKGKELQEAIARMHLTQDDYETVIFTQNLVKVYPETINKTLLKRRAREGRGSGMPAEFREDDYAKYLPSHICLYAKRAPGLDTHSAFGMFRIDAAKTKKWLEDLSEDSGLQFVALKRQVRKYEERIGQYGNMLYSWQ
ncbi:MAG: hypothetical protein Q9202_007014 [Teloschistes flavicans]